MTNDERSKHRRPAARELIHGTKIGLAVGIAILATGVLLVGWDPEKEGEYAITNSIGNLLILPSISMGACVTLLLLRHGYRAFGASIAATLFPYVVAMVYEICTTPASHNLFPLELGALLIGSTLLHLPAWICRSLLARSHSRA